VSLYAAKLSPTGFIQPQKIASPPQLEGAEPILFQVTWANDRKIVAVWMNRVQNVGFITLCDSTEKNCRNVRSSPIVVVEGQGGILP